MSINPTANRGREVSNALELYDKLAQEEGFEATINTSSGWIWKDNFLITDFKLLKPSNEPSLTTALTNLQCFYLMYFGEVATPANPGGLFCQLLATSPHFSSPKDQLIEFDKKGTIEICQYTPFPDVDTVLKRFLDDEAPPAQDLDKEITAPVPENEAHLLGSPADPEFAGDEKEATTRLTAADLEETGMFRMAVIVAFKALQNVKETDCWSAHKSYRSLHLTAVFLILIRLRRVTKKAADLAAAFNRSNIHRHYTDMVPDLFGSVLPPPASSLNSALEQALSNTQSGRHIFTMVFYLMYTNTVTITDQPVAYLGQSNLSLESILKATCMTHIAGSGLPLVTLSVILKTVYNKDERATIEWLSYKEIAGGLNKIIKLRSTQYKKAKDSKATFKLFPYCRLIHQTYLADLGYRGNEDLCYLMACLIDEKSPPPPGTGGARAAEWTKSLNSKTKSEIQKVACKMFEGESSFRLTSFNSNKTDYKVDSHAGEKWTPRWMMTTLSTFECGAPTHLS